MTPFALSFDQKKVHCRQFLRRMHVCPVVDDRTGQTGSKEMEPVKIKKRPVGNRALVNSTLLRRTFETGSSPDGTEGLGGYNRAVKHMNHEATLNGSCRGMAHQGPKNGKTKNISLISR